MKNTDLNKEVGGRIRMIREYSNLTREVLAEKGDISVQFLADIENGRKSMTVKTLKKLSESLMVSCDYIVFGKPPSASDQNAADESPLYNMLEMLTPRQREGAEELLKIYIRAVHSEH